MYNVRCFYSPGNLHSLFNDVPKYENPFNDVPKLCFIQILLFNYVDVFVLSTLYQETK